MGMEAGGKFSQTTSGSMAISADVVVVVLTGRLQVGQDQNRRTGDSGRFHSNNSRKMIKLRVITLKNSAGAAVGHPRNHLPDGGSSGVFRRQGAEGNKQELIYFRSN